VWHALAGLDVDVDRACATLVDRHFADSKRELLAICDRWGDEDVDKALQRKLQTWEEDRAKTSIDQLIQFGAPAPASVPARVDAPRVRTVSMANAVLRQVMAK
jgi:hypothetical protein